jgi:hypothetical protein
LETPEHRGRIAQAVLAAVNSFCAREQGKAPARQTSRKQI